MLPELCALVGMEQQAQPQPLDEWSHIQGKEQHHTGPQDREAGNVLHLLCAGWLVSLSSV